jgi:HK97 family phage major capsid protein
VEARGADHLSEDEQTELDEIRAAVQDIDADIATLEARLADLEADDAKKAAAAVKAAKYQPTIQTIAAEQTYSKAAAKRGVSFLKDVVAARFDGDFDAMQRLNRHRHETVVDGLVEARDVGTGAFAGLTVPQYLTDLAAPKARAGRPFADIARGVPLPDDGMTVNISRITTGAATAIQAAENDAVQETNMDDTLLTVDVRTIAGQQDVSRQAIERGTGIEDVVVADLIFAYHTNLDNQIINGAGTSGTHLGVLNVVGINAVAYTDATPTVAELYPKFADAVQQVADDPFMGISAWLMHPRRWWWIAKELGSTFPFLQFPNAPVQVAGEAGGSSYNNGGPRNILGIPVVLDANIPTNLGAGTNEDIIVGVTADECFLWEQAEAPLFLRAEQVGAGNLNVKLVVYGYSAFTAGRYPGAISTIGGTGLVLPVF